MSSRSPTHVEALRCRGNFPSPFLFTLFNPLSPCTTLLHFLRARVKFATVFQRFRLYTPSPHLSTNPLYLFHLEFTGMLTVTFEGSMTLNF